MVRRKRRLLVGWPIVLVLLLTILMFGVARADDPPRDPQDVTSWLTNVTLTVSQNGGSISPGGTISSTDPILVNVSFWVPVEGDEPTPANPVKKGDWAEFQLSNAFALTSGTTIPLNTAGGIRVGTVTFSTGSGGMVTARVDFNGDDEVFDGTYNSVECEFNATLEYNSSGAPVTGGEYEVMILDKTFTVVVPPVEIVYTATKTGTVHLNTQRVEWSVTLTAKQGATNVDLGGYKFVDNLSAVGDYISGTFQVGGETKTPTWNSTDKELSYEFPAGSTSPQTVTFATKIPDAKYHATSQQSITNTGQLKDGEDEMKASAQRTVTFTPQWIEKSGAASDTGSGNYDPTNRTITWTINVNQMGADLSDVVIYDKLPDGLTWLSASWEKKDGSNNWVAGGTFTTEPTDHKYSLGAIDTEARLIIVAKVPDEAYVSGVTHYTNTATVTWSGSPSAGLSGGATVGVGYTPITKSGSADPSTRQVTWTVEVGPRGQSIPNPTVYDLIVYGQSIDLSGVNGIPAGIASGDLTPRYGQKYVEGSFVGSGLTVDPIAITDGSGVQVADLLKITGFPQAGWSSFTFKTLVLDPNIFAGNKQQNVSNTATLFSGTTKLNHATATVPYTSTMLAKEMLKRGYVSDPAAGVNDFTTTAADGFDYQDHSVIFRLAVNADGLDLTGLDESKMGAAHVTDILPAGWEFVDIVPGSKYLIFEGTKSGSSVSATGSSLDSVLGLSTSFVGNEASFHFTTLDKPYVILVKARPTDSKLAEYFGDNKTTTERNNVSLYTANWTPGVSTHQDVSIKSTLVDKSRKLLEAGVVRWTIEYRPYDVAPEGARRLEDTLPVGVDLRTDSSGNLILSGGNITAQELVLQPDGTYADGTVLDLINADPGVSPSYDSQTRVLTLRIPNPTKAYRFTYLTDITAESGTVKNTVTLWGETAVAGATSEPYQITEADGSASLQKNGWIEITKRVGSADGALLAGARFTVLALDGETIIRTGFTGADGKLRLKVIPDGTYILRESAPTGYSPEKVDRTLTVATVDGTVNVTLDGKPGNYHTVLNYLEGTVGDLTISKVVAGNGADQSKQFEFTVTFVFPESFTGDPTSSFVYYGTGVPNGTIASGGTIALAHGQSITIVGLPNDTTYSVTERDYTSDNYSTTATGDTGTIVADQTQAAAFTNTRNEGDLTIVKTVGGNAGDTIQKFIFTVTFTGDPNAVYSYVGNGVPDGALKSGGTIALAHGQSITFVHLPENLGYTVTESDYSSYGYVTTSKGGTGTVVAKTTQTAAFTNTRNVYPPTPEDKTGDLTITKTVTGTGGSWTKQFIFTVTFDAAPDTVFRYIGEGVAGGTIKSGGTIALAHGQSITIVGLPEGTRYTVTEGDYSQDGYVTSSWGASGTIVARTTQTASFTNAHKVTPPEPEDKTGGLTITKTVTGDLGDRNKEFTFVVTLSVPGSYNYSGSKTGTISNGGTITLKHGEYIVIEGLPVGATYEVREQEAGQDGYTTTATGAAGAIVEAGRTAAFVNTRSTTPTTGDTGTTTSTTAGGGGTTPTTGGSGGTTPTTGGSGGTTPKTGDSNWGTVWGIGLGVSALLFLVLVGVRASLRNRQAR